MGCAKSKNKRENISRNPNVKDVPTPKSIRKESSQIDLVNDELLLETKDEQNFVIIQVDDIDAFNESFVQQCQQVIDNQEYRSIIESWCPDSLEQLTELIKKLTENKSPIDCYWIIFYWVAYNISYDTVSYFSKNYLDQTAEGVFRNKKGVCAGYANIYKYLCDQLNISCEIVSGFSKGYGFDDRDDPLSDTDHAWNVIEIDNHKYLMESTWAAGHLTDEKLFERKLNTYYFCPRPNEMIYHHLPENDKWQLLKTSVNKTQFLRMPKIHPLYFELNLELLHPRHQVDVDLLPHKSYALVLLKVPNNVQIIADLKLDDRKISGGHRVIYNKDKQIYYCYFAPNTIGKHKITLYGKRNETEGNVFGAVVELILLVKEMSKTPISFPSTWDRFFDFNVNVISPKNTHLITLDNKSYAEILISTPDDVELLGRLSNADGEYILDGHQVYFNRQTNLWQCRFAPNNIGLFEAEIMSKKKSDSDSFESTISFTIDAKRIPLPPMSFPKTWQLFHDLQLVVETPQHRSNAIWPDNASFAEIIISAPDDVELLGRLMNTDEQKIMGGDRVYFDRKKKLWRCLFAPNVSGKYTAEIMAKKKSEATLYTSAVSFTLEATSVPLPSLSFPKTWQLFHDLDLQIISPQNTARIQWNDENTSYSEIRMLAPDNVRLSCTMRYNDTTEKNTTLAQFDQEKRQWQLLFAPQQTGVYELNVFAQQLSTSGKSTRVARFELTVTKLNRSFIFPLIYKEFEDHRCRIYEPFDGILKKDSTIPIHCYIPDAIEVDIQVDSKWLNKNDYKNSILKTEITVGSTDVKIYAKFKQDGNFDGLINYSVVVA